MQQSVHTSEEPVYSEDGADHGGMAAEVLVQTPGESMI